MKKQTNNTEPGGSSPASGSPSSEYVPFGPEWEAEVMKHRKADLVAMFRKACLAKQAAADAIPRNWLDSLLTGPEATLIGEPGTWNCQDIERLLNGVRRRINAENARDLATAPRQPE